MKNNRLISILIFAGIAIAFILFFATPLIGGKVSDDRPFGVAGSLWLDDRQNADEYVLNVTPAYAAFVDDLAAHGALPIYREFEGTQVYCYADNRVTVWLVGLYTPTSLDIETIHSIGDAHFIPLGFTSAQPAPSDSTISFHWVDKRNGGYISLIASDGGMTIRGTSDFRPTSQHFNADVCDNNYAQSDWERALPIHPDELVRATKDGLIPQSDAQNATPQSTR